MYVAVDGRTWIGGLAGLWLVPALIQSPLRRPTSLFVTETLPVAAAMGGATVGQ